VQPGDPALRQAHRLLRRIFPTAELVRRTEWSDSLRERAAGLWTDISWHLVVAEAGARVVGVATGNYLGNVNTAIVGYVAVAPSARRLGLGPKLRRRLRAIFRADARRILHRPLQAIVGEVRRDNPWLETLTRREHALALDFSYLQPRLRRDARPVPLVFYYESLDRVRRSIPATELRRLLYTVWRRIYRISRPLADPAFRHMLRQLEGRRRVGPLPSSSR